MNDLVVAPSISREEIFVTLKLELVELLCLESSDAISEDTRLVEDLEIDSLGMVDLVMQVEDCFDIVLPTNTDLSKIKRVGDVLDLLDKPQSTKLSATTI